MTVTRSMNPIRRNLHLFAIVSEMEFDQSNYLPDLYMQLLLIRILDVIVNKLFSNQNYFIA